jgi:nitroreductase
MIQDKINYDALKSCVEESNHKLIQNAPVLVVTLAKTYFERNKKINIHSFHDVGLAVSNLALQATSLGLLVHQIGGFDTTKIRKAFHIPQDHEPVSILAIGYPQESKDGDRANELAQVSEPNRKPLREFVFAGTWGKVSPLVKDL